MSYYELHKEERLAYQKLYNAEHKDKYAEYQREYNLNKLSDKRKQERIQKRIKKLAEQPVKEQKFKKSIPIQEYRKKWYEENKERLTRERNEKKLLLDKPIKKEVDPFLVKFD